MHNFVHFIQKPIDLKCKLKDEHNNDIDIENLLNSEHKFLGQMLSFKNSAMDHFNFIQGKMKSKLENLNNASIGE